MVVVLALAFLLSATVTIYFLFRIGDTRVPGVVGKSESDAQNMAQKAGLRVKVQRRTDAHIPENIVIESRPAPNSSVKKDSNITLVVSSGASQSRSELHWPKPAPRSANDPRAGLSRTRGDLFANFAAGKELI